MDTYFWLKDRDRWPHFGAIMSSKIKIDEDKCLVFVDKVFCVKFKICDFQPFGFALESPDSSQTKIVRNQSS